MPKEGKNNSDQIQFKIKEVNVWLPLLHIMIGNMKKFINELFITFRPGTSKNHLYLDRILI